MKTQLVLINGILYTFEETYEIDFEFDFDDAPQKKVVRAYRGSTVDPNHYVGSSEIREDGCGPATRPVINAAKKIAAKH